MYSYTVYPSLDKTLQPFVTESYDEALKELKDLQSNGCPDAFMVTPRMQEEYDRYFESF